MTLPAGYRCPGLSATMSDAISGVLLTITTSGVMVSTSLVAGFLFSGFAGASSRRPPAGVFAAVICVALNCFLVARLFSF